MRSGISQPALAAHASSPPRSGDDVRHEHDGARRPTAGVTVADGRSGDAVHQPAAHAHHDRAERVVLVTIVVEHDRRRQQRRPHERGCVSVRSRRPAAPAASSNHPTANASRAVTSPAGIGRSGRSPRIELASKASLRNMPAGVEQRHRKAEPARRRPARRRRRRRRCRPRTFVQMVGRFEMRASSRYARGRDDGCQASSCAFTHDSSRAIAVQTSRRAVLRRQHVPRVGFHFEVRQPARRLSAASVAASSRLRGAELAASPPEKPARESARATRQSLQRRRAPRNASGRST